MRPTEALLADILSALLSRGGDYADVFYEDVSSTLLEAEGGQIEKVATGREAGMGLRVVRGQSTSFATTSDTAPSSVLALARALASEAQEGQGPGMAAKLRAVPRGPLRVGQDPGAVPLEAKADIVGRAVRAAQGCDSRIVQVKSVYRDSVSEVVIASSEGALAEDRRGHGVFLVQAVASSEGCVQVGYEPAGGTGGFELFSRLDVEQVALLAARRALALLSAREAPSGRMTVVLSAQAGGTMIHEAVGHGLEADLADGGFSVYSGKLGQAVASPLITVVDDPTLPGRRGSYNVDDEGVPARRNVLVRDGVLVSFMNDRILARRAGTGPTGNGRRQSFRHWPIPRMSNTMILPGMDDPEKILRSVDYGLLVVRMGGGQVNTVTGDFVFEVGEGYLIRGGEAAEAVRGATLAGSGPEVLKSVDMVGSDLGFGLGTCGKEGQGVPVGDAQPTLRIPDIVVGGRDAGGRAS